MADVFGGNFTSPFRWRPTLGDAAGAGAPCGLQVRSWACFPRQPWRTRTCTGDPGPLPSTTWPPRPPRPLLSARPMWDRQGSKLRTPTPFLPPAPRTCTHEHPQALFARSPVAGSQGSALVHLLPISGPASLSTHSTAPPSLPLTRDPSCPSVFFTSSRDPRPWNHFPPRPPPSISG